ncbi:MAG: hypothetical protein ACPG77_21165, partial [Nannocystaceae bacterium]
MASSLKIKPEIDPRALAKAREQLDKVREPTTKAAKEIVATFRTFDSSAKSLTKTMESSRDSAKDYNRDLRKAETAAQKMRTALSKAERDLGASDKHVRAMRKEYRAAKKQVKQLRTQSDAVADATERTARAEAKATKNARRRVKVLEKARGALKGGLKGLAVGAAGLGAAVTAGAGALLTNSFSGLLEGADAAKKSLSFTTEEFGRMQHAAEMSGVSMENVDKGLSNLNVKLANPNDATTKAIAELGINLEELTAAGGEQRLGMVADAIGG